MRLLHYIKSLLSPPPSEDELRVGAACRRYKTMRVIGRGALAIEPWDIQQNCPEYSEYVRKARLIVKNQKKRRAI